MRVEPLSPPDVRRVIPEPRRDARGFFCELFNRARFAEAGIVFEPVQENQAVSAQAGVVRGLHLQGPPAAQAKLVRVGRGRIFDAAVDVRAGSPTYGRAAWTELGPDEGWLYVPAGFAHGYAVLEPDTEVLYLVDAPYAPEHERALLWNDPALGVPWPVSDAVVSPRDAAAPPLAAFETPFR